MTTAKGFAARASAWHALTPGLDNLVRWANRNPRYYGSPTGRPSPDRQALVAETAFHIASGSESMAAAEKAARKSLSGLERSASKPRLNRGEQDIVQACAKNLSDFSRLLGRDPEFSPRIQGYGTVGSCRADIATVAELAEIKTVSRMFRSLDLRQTLVYAALMSQDHLVEKIHMYNPMTCQWFTSRSIELAIDLGSVSWIHLIQNIQEEMTSEPINEW